MVGPLAEIGCRIRRPRTLATWLIDRLFDHVFDQCFGISSSTRASLSSLNLEAVDRAGYQAISYLDFPRLIDGVNADGIFIDFGSGAGRCVCLAAQQSFERVIGVELSESLCGLARANIRTRRITNAQIECADATAYQIPPEATVFCFNNPFRGKILEAVLANIIRSAAEHSRAVTVLASGSPIDAEFFRQFQEAQGLQLCWRTILPTGCIGMVFMNSSPFPQIAPLEHDARDHCNLPHEPASDRDDDRGLPRSTRALVKVNGQKSLRASR
jgi:predicted RNA methylase